MIRTTYGVTARTRVAVGRIIAFMSSHGRAPGGMIVIAGRKPGNTLVAKITTRAMPTTNSGSAAKTSVVTELVTSNDRSRFSAAYDPMAIEIGIEMIPERNTRKAEFTT